MVDRFRGNSETLMHWAQREYEDAIASRYGYDMLLKEWSRQYEAIPLVARRESPWQDASNLEVPEGASHTDTVFSRIEEAWFATNPWAKVNYYHPQLKDGSFALQEFINQVTLPKANYRTETPHGLLGMTKLGTSFQWCSFQNETYRYMRNGKIIIQPVHIGPMHKYVSPRQVIVPPDARDNQRSRWIAIRSYFTWGELEHQRNLGAFDDTDKIAHSGRVINTDANREGERESGISRSGSLLQWEIVHMFARYYNPVSKDLEEIWIVFDYPSYTLLSAMYIPYDHLMRPLTKYTYMIREGAFYGIGVMGMLSAIQEEISTIHNYTLDAMLFSNAPMISGPRNLQNVINVHPGAYLPRGNKGDEFQVFQAGMVHQSAYQSEMSSRGIGERRTGIGNESLQRLGSSPNIRTPVGTTAMLLGETNRRFAMSISLGKEAEGSLLKQHVMLIKQFWPDMKAQAYAWNPQKARQIDDLMTLPDEVFIHGVGVELSMSTATLNRDVEKANLATLGAYMKEYYLMFLQLIQQLKVVPQMENEIRQVLDSAKELATLTLRTFDIRNAEEVLPSVDKAVSGGAGEGNIGDEVDQFVSEFLTNANTGAVSAGALSAGGGVGQDTDEVNFIE